MAIAEADTAEVFMVNVPVVFPAGQEGMAGTVTAIKVEATFTKMGPLDGPGAALSVMVPVALAPPVTEAGEMVKAVTTNGLTVSVAV